MDSHERAVLSDVLKTLHALVGRSDAQADLRPILQFVPERVQEKKSPEPFFGSGEEQGVVSFTEKELETMPKTIKNLLIIQQKVCHLRVRKTGSGNTTYEIRMRSDGYNVTACGKTVAVAKMRFLKKLRAAKPREPWRNVPTTFTAFATYFFDNFHQRKVSEYTFRNNVAMFKNHLEPHLKDLSLARITPSDCQRTLDVLYEKGQTRAAQAVKNLLNQIFENAIAHGLMQRNPLALVIVQRHEYQHGTALTVSEERKLLAELRGTPFERMFAVALYTGMRPNEFKTAKIEGGFIVCRNSKRKNGRIEHKKIPVTPLLAPYLEGVTELTFSPPEKMRDVMKGILPNHILYDLRTTFFNRCKECGVSDYARDEFMGHSTGAIGDSYTDLSDEYLLSEGQKLRY